MQAVSQWLAVGEGDGAIDRTLNAIVQTQPTFVYTEVTASIGQTRALAIDSAQRGVLTKLGGCATSVLLTKGSTSQYFNAGNFTLWAGGDYTMKVGTWYCGPGDPPATATVGYSRRTA
jgi:hypothetical protein